MKSVTRNVIFHFVRVVLGERQTPTFWNYRCLSKHNMMTDMWQASTLLTFFFGNYLSSSCCRTCSETHSNTSLLLYVVPVSQHFVLIIVVHSLFHYCFCYWSVCALNCSGIGEMKSSRWTEASIESSAQQLRDHNVGTGMFHL